MIQSLSIYTWSLGNWSDLRCICSYYLYKCSRPQTRLSSQVIRYFYSILINNKIFPTFVFQYECHLRKFTLIQMDPFALIERSKIRDIQFSISLFLFLAEKNKFKIKNYYWGKYQITSTVYYFTEVGLLYSILIAICQIEMQQS